LFVGGVHVTVALKVPLVAETEVGALGTLMVCTPVEAADAFELPTMFVATTLKVYVVAVDNGLIAHESLVPSPPVGTVKLHVATTALLAL
jgi:hypothetical protein